MTQEELLALIDQAAAEEWTELDLSGQYLEELPPEIGKLQSLQVLKLGYNKKTKRRNYLTDLPETLVQLIDLQSLDLSGLNLSTLPKVLAQLTNLQSFDLSSNNLTTLPEWLAQLTNLISLDLSDLNLTTLPEWLTQLTNLTSLDLSALPLTVLPEWLTQLTDLQSLYLGGLNLTALPKGLAKLANLQSLDLSYNSLTTLPEGLAQLTELQSLYLSSNNLTALPEWLAQLTNLQSLDLSSNNLTALPEWLAQLTNLQSLNLSSNNLTTLPKGLAQLTNLKSLYLSSNNLTALPEWLAQLTNLQSLFLSALDLTTLPKWLAQLTNLQSLYLRSNNLTTLPEWLAQLTNLQSLYLSSNNLANLPEGLAQLTNLQSLSLSTNNLTTLPEWLAQLTNLQSLNLSSNSLTTLPEGLAQLTNLQSLYLRSNNLTALSKGLAQLINLQSLSLSSNNLTTLPEGLAQLTNLQSLHLSSNNLSTLPEWLAQLTNLQSLSLSSNNLTALPEGLAQLTNLQSLSLSTNNLTTLPEWLAQLTNLQSLYIRSNNLTALPEWLTILPHLNILQVADNPISEPTQEVLGEALTKSYKPVDIKALRRYFDQLKKASTITFYEAKLLIIGEGGAGKTSLACKLQDPEVSLSPDEESTEGIDITHWHFPLPPDCEEEQYRVNIWDFGGQAVYFATHQFFLTKRSVYILVTDTRQQHTDFYTWLRMQETFGGDSTVILLKNRNRRHGNRFTIENLPELRKRFPNLKEVFELDLSSVPDGDVWPQLIRELEHRFMSLDHVGKLRPLTWVNVRETLSDDNRDTITRQEYLDLCTSHEIEQKADALQLSDYLHNLGDILHFQEDPVLKELVILQPTWGLDAVYRVLDNVTVVENRGQFTLTDLYGLWHEAKYTGHHHQLLRLMQNFQLCYPLQDQPDTYIAPQLLGSDVPEYTWNYNDNLQLRYRYPEFMPRGILSRTIVKLHHQIEAQELVWRSGVILNDGYARAELLEMRGDMEIRIRISGTVKRDLLMEVVRALDSLHEGFPKLRYEKRIPCNCVTCKERPDPHFYDLKNLLDRLSNRKETIECNHSPYENVPIRRLLDDGVQIEPGRRDDPFHREAIVNVYGDLVNGDRYDIGGIESSETIAIGRSALANKD